MGIANTPRVGAIVDITESIAAGSGSAVPQVRNVTIGCTASAPTSAVAVQLIPGTGGPMSINQVLDGFLTLGANATFTIDLTNFTGSSGTKTLAKCRGYDFLNTAAADAGSANNFTVSATASNGFTAGGKLPPSTAPATVEPNSQFFGDNLNSAGWTVNGAAKTVIITAGSGGANLYFAFWGE